MSLLTGYYKTEFISRNYYLWPITVILLNGVVKRFRVHARTGDDEWLILIRNGRVIKRFRLATVLEWHETEPEPVEREDG